MKFVIMIINNLGLEKQTCDLYRSKKVHEMGTNELKNYYEVIKLRLEWSYMLSKTVNLFCFSLILRSGYMTSSRSMFSTNKWSAVENFFWKIWQNERTYTIYSIIIMSMRNYGATSRRFMNLICNPQFTFSVRVVDFQSWFLHN